MSSIHSITLRRSGMRGFLSSNPLAIDALNALAAIDGVENVTVLTDSLEQVVLSYTWVGENPFLETPEHLSKYGVERAD